MIGIPQGAKRCPFCNYNGPSDVLGDYHDTYVIEPLDPVTPGHVIVIPKAHVADFSADLEVTRRVSVRAAIWAQDHPGDYNFITSKGSAATQTIDHLHLHVVPRLPGDGLMLPWSQPRTLLVEGSKP